MSAAEPAVEVRKFATARQLVDALDISLPHWTPPSSLTSRWVFRGHSDSSWRLEPPVWRRDRRGPDAPSAQMRAMLAKLGDPAPNAERFPIQASYHELRLRLATEIALVSAFASLANDLGIPVPGHEFLPSRFDLDDPRWYEELTDLAERHVPREGNARPHALAANSAFALAQHHGIPTRLLDWSRDPLVSAYFAAECAPRTGDGSLCVWAIDSAEVRQSEELEIVDVPRSQVDFLHAQSGLFLLHVHAESLFAAHGEWPDLHEALARRGIAGVRRYELPHTESAELSRVLWRRRISRAHLMPTYDSVTAALKRQWELMSS